MIGLASLCAEQILPFNVDARLYSSHILPLLLLVLKSVRAKQRDEKCARESRQTMQSCHFVTAQPLKEGYGVIRGLSGTYSIIIIIVIIIVWMDGWLVEFIV